MCRGGTSFIVFLVNAIVELYFFVIDYKGFAEIIKIIMVVVKNGKNMNFIQD